MPGCDRERFIAIAFRLLPADCRGDQEVCGAVSVPEIYAEMFGLAELFGRLAAVSRLMGYGCRHLTTNLVVILNQKV
jgi:hypothetical protein